MDERVSIRSNTKPLRKYGSISSNSNFIRSDQVLIKHVVTETDTLQGLALKYSVTTEQIRNANRLFTNDSLFLREHLYIPASDTNAIGTSNIQNSMSKQTNMSPIEEHNIDDCNNFLNKIDNKIASARAQVIDSQDRSVYCPEEQVLFTRQRLSTRRIQGPSISTDDSIPIIVTQNKKLMSSRQRLEQEEEEMFSL